MKLKKTDGVNDFLNEKLYLCTRFWRDARVAEEARLESVYTSKAYPGFESPSLRRNQPLHSRILFIIPR